MTVAGALSIPITTSPDRRQPAPGDPRLPQTVGALVGGGLLVYGARRRGLVGAALGAAGMGILAGALASPAEQLLLRSGTARRAAQVRHTFAVAQPVRDAFAFFNNFEHFPRVLPSLQSVEDFLDGRSRWRVRTLGGQILEWDALVTKYVPNQVIGWESLPGAPVDSTGLVRFTPAGPDRTEVELTLTFAPRDASLGEAVRALLAPPLHVQLEDALTRTSAEVERWATERTLSAD